MNRDEFIMQARKIESSEYVKIASKLRENAGKRIPPEVAEKFRSLDDVTEAKGAFLDTDFGKTAFYLISDKNTSDGPKPVIINVHGGGWCLPHSERDIFFCRRLALKTGCLVVDIDYVLAPEHPYPEAIEEIEALLNNIFPKLVSEWGGDANRVILCGQSAGGNLLGAVSQRNRCFENMHVLKQILCYLPTDNYNNRFGEMDLDERNQSTEYYGFFYNSEFEDRKRSDVSLVYASNEELSHIPATDILTAGLDNLMPEGRRYYELIQDAGIISSYKCFENSRHGFLVNMYDEWQEGEDYLVQLIKEVL